VAWHKFFGLNAGQGKSLELLTDTKCLQQIFCKNWADGTVAELGNTSSELRDYQLSGHSTQEGLFFIRSY
jgi:hypothetical protein